MKRIIALALCLLMFSLSGCGKKEPPKTETQEKLSVVTTIFPPYDFTREIAGDTAEVTALLPHDSESHTYEPTLKDIAAVADCDIFICVGGEIDPWAESLWGTTLNSERKIIRLLDIVGEEHTHIEGEEHLEETDQHVWTSPENVMEIVKVIAENLCDADPKNTSTYTTNRIKYLEKLKLLHSEFEKLGEEAAHKTLVFADRFPFSHLCEDYGFTAISALSGCSSDTEPTISAVNELISTVKAENTPAVLYTETADGNIAKTVMEATGCGKKLLHSCHNISSDEYLQGENYLSLMNQNLATLREVLVQ